jgi:autotransporter strand-loop-strand O-heptosyltransferase
MYTQFTEDIFVIDCWLDTKEKELALTNLIERIKVYNIPIILCGHYPIKTEFQEMVDYCIYDKNNDILEEKDFEEYGVVSDRWTETDDFKINNKVTFHHDYAIWLTMKNAFNLANQLGKKYIHFLEYDNLPDEIQYRQAFIEYIRHHDAVVYEYSEGSTNEPSPFSATYIFSIKTEIALSLINKINSKKKFFLRKQHEWQLEKTFYQTLQTVTDKIFVTKYIANDDELNLFAAWNRDGINRNGARFQTYLGVDDNEDLSIHFISGFNNKPATQDYVVEINYGVVKEFYKIIKGNFHLKKLGKYVKGLPVKVYYQGIEVFSDSLSDDVMEFKRKNNITRKNKEISKNINVNFIDGPFIEILEKTTKEYHVEFIDNKSGRVLHETNIKSNHWTKASIKYYVDWLIKVSGVDNDFYFEHKFNPNENRFFISFESKSLGDSLAFIPYVDEFRKKHNCSVVCSTFFNDLFKNEYPEIEFVSPGSTVNNIYGLYRIGMFYNDSKMVDYEKHLTDPKKEPLLKIASDILGLDYKEVRPKLPKIGNTKQKLVTIAIHSTAQAKYWNNPTGWQEVVDYLNGKGYEVRLLSKEEDGYMGNIHPKGITQQPAGDLNSVIKTIQESEFFIGISSGLSWLAWGCGTPTILISGFTDVFAEPFDNVYRVINKEVCNSCWSDYDFDAGNWNWCPVHSNTNKQFECSKQITSKQVIGEIDKLIN